MRVLLREGARSSPSSPAPPPPPHEGGGNGGEVGHNNDGNGARGDNEEDVNVKIECKIEPGVFGPGFWDWVETEEALACTPTIIRMEPIPPEEHRNITIPSADEEEEEKYRERYRQEVKGDFVKAMKLMADYCDYPKDIKGCGWDVIFVMDNEKGEQVRVFAHALILRIAESDRLNELVTLALAHETRKAFKVEGMTAEVMKLIIQCVYGSPNLDFKTPLIEGRLTMMMSFAKQYRATRIYQRCINFLRDPDTLNVDTAMGMLKSAMVNGEDELKEEAIQFIGTYARKVFGTRAFKKAPRKVIAAIIASDSLAMKEPAVFQHLVDWTKYKLKNPEAPNAPISPQDLRRRMGEEIVKLIRFSLFDGGDFTRQVVCGPQMEGFLTPPEVIEIFTHAEDSTLPTSFPTQPRNVARSRSPSSASSSSPELAAAFPADNIHSDAGSERSGSPPSGLETGRVSSLSAAEPQGTTEIMDDGFGGFAPINPLSPTPCCSRSLFENEAGAGSSSSGNVNRPRNGSGKRQSSPESDTDKQKTKKRRESKKSNQEDKREERSESGNREARNESRTEDNHGAAAADDTDNPNTLSPHSPARGGIRLVPLSSITDRDNDADMPVDIDIADIDADLLEASQSFQSTSAQSTPKKNKLKLFDAVQTQHFLNLVKRGDTLTHYYESMKTVCLEDTPSDGVFDVEGKVIDTDMLDPITVEDLNMFNVTYIYNCDLVPRFKTFLQGMNPFRALIFVKESADSWTDEEYRALWIRKANFHLSVNEIKLLDIDHQKDSLIMSWFDPNTANQIFQGLEYATMKAKSIAVDQIDLGIDSQDVLLGCLEYLSSLTLRKVGKLVYPIKLFEDLQIMEELSIDDLKNQTIDFEELFGSSWEKAIFLRKLCIGNAQLDCKTVPEEPQTHSPVQELCMQKCKFEGKFLDSVVHLLPNLKKAMMLELVHEVGFGSRSIRMFLKLLEIGSLEEIVISGMKLNQIEVGRKGEAKRKKSLAELEEKAKVIKILKKAGLRENDDDDDEEFDYNKRGLSLSFIMKRDLPSNGPWKATLLGEGEVLKLKFEGFGWNKFYSDHLLFEKMNPEGK